MSVLPSAMVKRHTVIIGLLAALLVFTNLWWGYRVLDGGVSYTYLKDSYDTEAELLRQTKAILSVTAVSSASKAEVLAAAQAAAPGAATHEKLGYTWVGQLGLKFNEQGRVIHAISSEQEAR
jgi:hypothetical protein